MHDLKTSLNLKKYLMILISLKYRYAIKDLMVTITILFRCGGICKGNIMKSENVQ